MKKDKAKFEDDGRTIANMNVEGMPWYKGPSLTGTGNDAQNGENPIEELSPSGRRAMTGGILAASLLIGSIYAIVILLFILFCIYVWFR